MKNEIAEIQWTRNNHKEGGYLLEHYSTQKFGGIFGVVCKVEKDDYHATSRGGIVTTTEKGAYEFDVYGLHGHQTLMSGKEDSELRAKAAVEKYIRQELEGRD